MTGRTIAEKTGRSQSYVYRVINGSEKPSRAFQEELSKLLGVPVSELFHSSSAA